MKAKLIANPYIVYSLAFLFTTVLYFLHWSGLYPTLSTQLFFFIIGTIILSFIAGIFFHSINYLSYKDVSYNSFILWTVSILVFIGYLFECAYIGVIPLLAMFNSSIYYDYTSFGIPTFHVVLVTFGSFWTVFVFHNFIAQKKMGLFFCFLLCLFPAILIFNRAMFLTNLGSSFFILFMSSKNLKKLLIKVAVIVIALLFLFGVAGNIRSTRGQTANNVILSLGQATDEFRASAIPKEFFWAFLYITSPLANFQQTINETQTVYFTGHRLGTFINREFIPDFISKRNTYFTTPYEHVHQISASFTVGTVYGRGFAYLRWWGVISMFFFIMVFNFLIIICLNKSSAFFVTGIAILNCIMLFSIFDNMFVFSGLSLQLFYPVVFGLFSKVRFSSKKSIS
ncbi:oligosaccharide repeat unit polymerase [Parafilimonas sp.]|uniref:oligosaccharide repeat unit polymerase n=1 Tax=Parafilimonas sp. TaxID=1969739 RepID=UPI003F7ECFD9